MTAVIIPRDVETPTNDRKSGLDYDDCPAPECGRRDINPQFRLGMDWGQRFGNPGRMIYHCDPRDGVGCGRSWTRTSGLAAEEDRAKGINPKHLTSEAARGRAISVPSDAYRENYSQIDWSK